MNESKQGREDEKTGECCISRAWNPLMALIAVKTSKEGKEKKRNRAQEATMTMASNTLNERSVRELKHVRASLKKLTKESAGAGAFCIHGFRSQAHRDG